MPGPHRPHIGAVVFAACLLQGCASGLSVGASFPVGGSGGVGVSVDPDGKVRTRVGVSVGGGHVSVGGTLELPPEAPNGSSKP